MRFRAALSLPLLVSALFTGNASAQAAQRPEVAAAAEAMKQKVVAWRRDFHEHPELSLHEERTAGKVTEHLRALGLNPVSLGGHGVMAIIQGGKPGPKIALRADMDALPWGGIDPIVAAADLIGSAQTIVSRRTNIARLPSVVTFGAIKGGIRYNIIPDDVELVGTIRTFDAGVREKIFADLRNVSEHVAAAHGATVEAKVPDSDGNPVTINDPALTARMLPSLQAVVGKDNVYEPALQMGAEDFSLYAQQVPGMFFFIGSTAKGIDTATVANNHSPQFLLDESSLDVGFRALMQVALDYLHQPGN